MLGSKHEPQDTQGGLTGWAFKASIAGKFEDLFRLAFLVKNLQDSRNVPSIDFPVMQVTILA